MSLSKVKHRKKKPSAKESRQPTQRQRGKRGWPDYDERENVFYTPTERPYAEVLTMRSPAAAKASIAWMTEEYKRASGQSTAKGVLPSKEWRNHITKAMDNLAKRAELSLKRPNLSAGEKVEMKAVAGLYKKALASKKFDNYYSAKREGAIMVPLAFGKKGARILAKGNEAGDPLLRFRTVKYTAKGTRIMAWKPFRLVYRGSAKKAQAKKAELAAAGFVVRVVREGKIHFTYVHTAGRGKWKYQPADRWFDVKLKERREAKTKKTTGNKERKHWTRAKKKTFKTKTAATKDFKRAKDAGIKKTAEYKVAKVEDGYKIVKKK